ncbi:MAG: hypothetical protein ACRDHJ_07125 [Actinomycetota bacterium]
MALRIAEPSPPRAAGLGATAVGALTTILSGFQGPPALVGLVVLCLGIALLDAVDAGGVGRRQLAVFLLSLGGVVGAWGLVVTALLAMLGLPPDRAVLILLVGGILAMGVAVFLIRYAPESRPAPAIVTESGAPDAGSRSRASTSQRLDRLAG